MARKKADNKIGTRASMLKSVEVLSTKSRPRAKTAATEGSGLTEEISSAVSRREKIALLAYTYWEQRGHPDSSPEEDWYRAERDIELGAST